MSQQAEVRALSPVYLQMLRDSADYADIVFYPPYQQSISLEGKNVLLVTTMIEPEAVPVSMEKETGYISLQIRGREIFFARLFLPESQKGGYVVAEIGGVVYRSRLTDPGAAFLRNNRR